MSHKTKIISLHPQKRLLLVLVSAAILLSGCMVGPNYHRPTAPVPPAYKELPPDNSGQSNNWKPAQPSDGAIRGKWWEIYKNPELNTLEEQVNISNQNVLLAEAQFREARDAVRIARASLFPTITTSPFYTKSKTSGTLFNVQAGNLTSGTRNIFDLPATVSYQADLWGNIRHSVRGSEEVAQATFAQLENVRLTLQAELAEDYYELHGTDGDEELLERTVKSYEDYLELTKYRFQSGVASDSDVAQAQTQLDSAKTQLIDFGVARAQFEHAIAVLTGKPPSALSIPSAAINTTPPPIPAGVPSDLLERRPDIAAAERQMAATNEQIGIAQAAYFPSLTLGASGGFESGSLAKWFTAPSAIWSVGPQFAATLFDAGRRHALVAEEQAAYDASTSSYRQTVLTAFQQVEDNLAALRILANEAGSEQETVNAAQHSLDIVTYQYKAGTVDYLSVITAQTTLLQDQVQAVNILTRRMMASVLLVEFLGGGWDASNLPTAKSLAAK